MLHEPTGRQATCGVTAILLARRMIRRAVRSVFEKRLCSKIKTPLRLNTAVADSPLRRRLDGLAGKQCLWLCSSSRDAE